jgi:hypothetical protein
MVSRAEHTNVALSLSSILVATYKPALITRIRLRYKANKEAEKDGKKFFFLIRTK